MTLANWVQLVGAITGTDALITVVLVYNYKVISRKIKALSKGDKDAV